MVRALLALLSLLLAAPFAWAVESAPVISPRARVTLVAEPVVVPGQTLRVLLRQRLSPGWHTYWLNPGDAGQAPEVALNLPEGSTAGALRFPAPTRFAFGPLVSFGYEGEALFLLHVQVPASATPGSRFRVSAEATWLVCEQVCIPEEGQFTLDLPIATTPRSDADATLLTAAEAAEPQPAPFPTSIGFNSTQGALRLTGLPGAVRDAFFFPIAQGLIDNVAPQHATLRDGTLTLALTRGEAPLPVQVAGVLTLTDAAGNRAAWQISATPGAMPSTMPSTGLPLWQALAFALLGGLILNAMPCVFPVLAMKAMALARLSGAAQSEVRAHAVSTVAGMVLSFLAMGGVLVALRVGWGFQFTAPWFVAALAWLMLAVGLNLSGVFAIGGPVGAGGALAARGGQLGSFATGALAVLVATPCTAPFMAAALGAALAMPPVAALLIFAGLGLGMAAPYAALALAPGLARLLPRPGDWMERLRQALAFPMYAAAAWLAWVLAQEAGADGLLLLLAGAVLLALAAWALGLHQREGHFWGAVLAGAALLAALALLPGLRPAAPTEAAIDAWSAERVAALRAEGRPVFVNLTAAWCVTCKVNERVALRDDAVRTAFASAGVATLTGDWTNGAPAITALLREHQRDGVPLYLLYPAGGGAPRLLPQILTPGILLRALGSG
jgi:thiol:disulfide interchange protein DsbD